MSPSAGLPSPIGEDRPGLRGPSPGERVPGGSCEVTAASGQRASAQWTASDGESQQGPASGTRSWLRRPSAGGRRMLAQCANVKGDAGTGPEQGPPRSPGVSRCAVRSPRSFLRASHSSPDDRMRETGSGRGWSEVKEFSPFCGIPLNSAGEFPVVPNVNLPALAGAPRPCRRMRAKARRPAFPRDSFLNWR